MKRLDERIKRKNAARSGGIFVVYESRDLSTSTVSFVIWMESPFTL